MPRPFGDSSREATELRLRLHASRNFGQRELRTIKPSVIQGWLRKLQQDLAPAYVRTIFTNVSAVFRTAVDDGLIASNPCQVKSVRLPKRDTQKVEPWTGAQVRAVIDALPRRYRAIASVAAGCRLRQGETFGLRVCDINFLRRRLNVEQQVKLLGGRVTIDKPKGGKTRTIPLPATVADYLGHADPGFTLRVYAHLFPSSEERARTALDRAMATGEDEAGLGDR